MLVSDTAQCIHFILGIAYKVYLLAHFRIILYTDIWFNTKHTALECLKTSINLAPLLV